MSILPALVVTLETELQNRRKRRVECVRVRDKKKKKMLGKEESNMLLTLLKAGDNRPLDEIVADFISSFPPHRQFYACISLALILDVNLSLSLHLYLEEQYLWNKFRVSIGVWCNTRIFPVHLGFSSWCMWWLLFDIFPLFLKFIWKSGFVLQGNALWIEWFKQSQQSNTDFQLSIVTSKFGWIELLFSGIWKKETKRMFLCFKKSCYCSRNWVFKQMILV